MLTFDVREELRRIAPAVWLGTIVIVMILNFIAGWRVDGFLIGAAFVLVAIFGAFCAAHVSEARGVLKGACVVMMVFQIALGQWAGWQAIGLNLAENTATLDSQAASHSTNIEALAAARERRKALGNPRPVDAIAAERELECSRKGKQYRDGKGPKCTALMSEEAAAADAAQLDKDIPDLQARLEGGAHITDANAPFSVAMKLSSAAASLIRGRQVEIGRDDVLFGFKIFFVFLLEFMATCGPWLLQRLGPAVAPRHEPTEWDKAPKRLTYHGPRAAAERLPDEGDHRFSGPQRAGAHSQESSTPGGGGFMTQPGGDGLHQPPAPPAGHSHGAGGVSSPSQSLTGAPINFFFGAADTPAASRPAAPGVPAVPVTTMIDKVSDGNVTALRSAAREAFAPAAPDVPVDRSAVNAAIDCILAFRAARLSDMPGAWVSGEMLYAAYAQHAGPRAVEERAFHGLFEAATGIAPRILGGGPHYPGVSVRPLLLAQEG